MSINGVINLNKRKGISSFRAVKEVMRALNASKAGHTGTLDPAAEGVLPVCIGKATRISEYLMQTKKEYIVSMYIGLETDTYDLEGEITAQKNIEEINQEDIEPVVNSFVGVFMQIPPIYSAIKVNGKKLYEYARKGERVEIKPREIEIYYVKNIVCKNTEYYGNKVIEASFTVGCSKGTYIRSLCHDIGVRLNSGCAMASLTRTATGVFKIEESYTIDEIKAAADENRLEVLLKDSGNLLELPLINLNKYQIEEYFNGRKIFIKGIEKGEYLIKSTIGETIGIGTVDENGLLKSRKRLL